MLGLSLEDSVEEDFDELLILLALSRSFKFLNDVFKDLGGAVLCPVDSFK